MADKPRHIRDLFTTGKKITIKALNEDGEFEEFSFWMRKPLPSDHQEVIDIAAAKAVRVRAKFRDKENPSYIALYEQVANSSADDLIDVLIEMKRDEFRREAYNIVLYDETYGSDWSSDGNDYISIVLAVANRLIEIEGHNKELSDEDGHLIIRPEEDEELKRLSAIQEEFEKEVEELVDQYITKERKVHAGKSVDKLREEVIKKLIETEVAYARLQAYKSNMIWRSSRDLEDKSTHYFKDVDELETLPYAVRTQIFDAYDNLEPKGDDIKNLLSLLPSST